MELLLQVQIALIGLDKDAVKQLLASETQLRQGGQQQCVQSLVGVVIVG